MKLDKSQDLIVPLQQVMVPPNEEYSDQPIVVRGQHEQKESCLELRLQLFLELACSGEETWTTLLP